MSEILFAVALFMLNVVVVLMAMTIKRLSKEIGETKARLGRHQAHFFYLDSCELDNEHRIDQLEDILELKEWFDKEKGEYNGNND